MEIKLNTMCDWERQKAIFLMGEAEKLGISLGEKSYGEVAVNSSSGYVYLYEEMLSFSLYMPINCELKKSDIYASWTCSECGQEEETQLTESDRLTDIEERIADIEREHNKEEHTDKAKY